MKVVLLDLFSGIGGFPKGLESAGFNITDHYFSEIDKHAIANYRHNFKDATYVGSVTDVRGSQLPQRPNIITFGSPCQDFSLAGKRKGMEGERSSLVSHAIRLITECRPDVFIWENVKGTFSSNNGADFWAIIQAFANIGQYRLEWQLLNTAWLLPQNRERIYLVGHLGNGSGRNVFPFRESDFYSSKMERGREISATLTTSYHKGHNFDNQLIQVKSATSSGHETATEGDSINLAQPNSETRRGRVGKGKAQTLETSCNQAVLIAKPRRTEEAKALRTESMKNGKDHTPFQGKEVVFEESKNMNSITCATQKDNLIIQMNPSKESNGCQPFQQNRVYSEAGHVPALCSQMSSGTHAVQNQSRIRRLTEIECERLQGFPDDWTKYGTNDKGKTITTSRTQRYKMCGNAVTVAVVKMIGDRLIQTIQKPQQ
jgi:DNA (cytosine-5)-methyltransferase 1